MNANQLQQLLAQAIPAKLPILIKGAPGIGKSDIVTKAAADANAKLVIMHPVVSDPTDFKGLPAIVKNEAEFLPFGDLRELLHTQELTVCFLDDIGQAPPAVQAALMQLILARQINGHMISDNVTFVAATNRREDKAGVSGMLEPVKSRFCSIVQLEVDVESWLQWAIDNNLPLSLIAFIKMRPELLHQFKASQDLINSPCPRTVSQLGKLITLDLPADLQYETYSGACGEGFTAEYLAFERIWKKLPSVDSILMNPASFPIPKDNTAPSVIYALCGALARKATDNSIDAICQFADILKENDFAEYSVMLLKNSIKQNKEIVNTSAFIKWSSKNASVLI